MPLDTQRLAQITKLRKERLDKKNKANDDDTKAIALLGENEGYLLPVASEQEDTVTLSEKLNSEKKRGRPKKQSNETDDKVDALELPKKRGRKPKSECTENANANATTVSPVPRAKNKKQLPLELEPGKSLMKKVGIMKSNGASNVNTWIQKSQQRAKDYETNQLVDAVVDRVICCLATGNMQRHSKQKADEKKPVVRHHARVSD